MKAIPGHLCRGSFILTKGSEPYKNVFEFITRYILVDP